MEKFKKLVGLAAPLDEANCDTDQIMPKQFLKRVEREGFGQYAFYDWRYHQDGSLNLEFVLNQDRYQGAQVLVTGENFGCGSSREHAPWALMQFGFRVIIAPSFADIFYNNSFNIGKLLIIREAAEVSEWMRRIEENEGYTITVDLETQTLTGSDGFHVQFDIDPFRKKCLLEGLDNIGLTLQHEQAITDYEKSHAKPWQAAAQ